MGGGTGRLLLSSAAGAVLAVLLSASRWLLSEAGEVLLLLFAGGDGHHAARPMHDDGGGACSALAAEEDASSFDRCAAADDGVGHPPRWRATPALALAGAGEFLRDAAASPTLRAAPLVLLVLSSALLVAAAWSARGEARRCRAWIRSRREWGEDCARRFLNAMVGARDADELGDGLGDEIGGRRTRWRDALRERVDGLVLDDALRNFIRAGVEFYAGTMGGVFLYGLLPDEMFADSSAGSKRARRRLMRAADPSWETILFRPGGAWDVLPFDARGYLTGGDVPPPKAIVAERPSDDENHGDEEGSGGTPSPSSPASSVHGADGPPRSPHGVVEGAGVLDLLARGDGPRRSDVARSTTKPDAAPAAPRPVVAVEIVPHGPTEGEGSFADETLAEALAGTVRNLVASHLMGGAKRPIADRDPQRASSPPPPSPPLLGLEATLRRLCVAAALLFVSHLRASPSARRSWMSAVRLLASAGLASAAVGSGAAAALLHTEVGRSGAAAAAWGPVAAALGARVADAWGVGDVGERVRRMMDRIGEEVRRNKRLHMALALVALGGMRSLSRRRRGIGRNAMRG